MISFLLSIYKKVFLIGLLCCTIYYGYGQPNLLLNGNFEDINTCKEYNAECGVEAWFYLKDVKVQMLSNETGKEGANSFAIFYNWNGYKDFTPIIGTILPCNLQQGKQYIFKGWINAKLNPQLILKPGISLGENFYVPKRPFSKMITPVPINDLKPVPETGFFEFEYRFTAQGNERYLTFGSFINADTTNTKNKYLGIQTVSLMPDNFSLTATDPNETWCAAYAFNKENIYRYNHRHKDMDYTLYGKGKLPVDLHTNAEENVTAIQTIPPPVHLPLPPDTLKLGDVLFDFNKADLKVTAVKLLETFFIHNKNKRPVDSLYIEGHTDSIGSDKGNMLLSKARSESIMRWMVTNNIAGKNRITIYPYGRSRPIATNQTPAGRALNRRVEIIVFRAEGKE